MSSIEDALDKKKELILEELKGLVLSVRNDAAKIRQTPDLFKARQQQLSSWAEKLTPEELEWVNVRYKKWFDKEILPLYTDDIKSMGTITKDQLRKTFGL